LAKLVPGVNDLATLYPEVAKQADGWDPGTVASKSGKKLEWLCKKGHIWSAVVASRTPPANNGCPVCANKTVLKGFNDFATLYPEMAKEAHGWDPCTVTAGSSKRLQWHCANGHTWPATVASRTPPTSSGCPFCAGQKVLPGVNDLATLYPDLAKQAFGWDPSAVTSKSHQKLDWCCEKGHTWQAVVSGRTPPTSSGCPICSGKKVLAGFNDLATLYPDVAMEAEGWDPTTVTTGNKQKRWWRCRLGHRWDATINSRLGGGRLTGCRVCSGQEVLLGFNDLATLYPEVAAQADGWDPASVGTGTKATRAWICNLGHRWSASVTNRTRLQSGCPYCSGRSVLKGFNDLATLYPALAKEAVGWDPVGVTCGNNKIKRWCCEKGHFWEAAVNDRTPPKNSGCPECSVSGFKKTLPACFYLLERPGEQQLGITNFWENRLRNHAQFGWSVVEVVGPFPGDQVLALEKKLKLWLRNEVGLVPGTHENWFTARMEVQSLAELKARSGVETDLF